MISAILLFGALQAWPGADWADAKPGEFGLDAKKLVEAREYALSGAGSGIVIRGGRRLMAWGSQSKTYDLKSSTKSIGITALGLAIKDGKIRLEDRARKHHPTLGTPPEGNAKTGWLDEITILHLATQTAGFEKPGGFRKLVFRPGARWAYSDGGPNWLAECVTLAYKRDVEDLLFERVFTPLGIKRKGLRWRGNAYRPRKIEGVERREFGSGCHASVDAMARIGLLYLRGGRWKEKQILPREFVDACRRPVKGVVGIPEQDAKHHGNASDHYGLLWWNNADGTLKGVPRDAYWSWGLYDSLIVVIPSLDLVVARAGKSWKREWAGHYDVLKPFLVPICASVRTAVPHARAPVPPSESIVGIAWAPASEIRRGAKGSDNWPITWGDDGHQYTAYGDGRGFKPNVPKKLSLGLARIEAAPDAFHGVNLRAETAERTGGGRSGEKASGMLMLDGTLYMFVRNADNSRLAWSRDRGTTWTWADWRFRTSFGYPSFLNYGRNYAGARDGYVYVFSPDGDSAYIPSDRMVLARVPKARVRERTAYEFFAGRDGVRPRWTADITDRRAVFEHRGRCYRSSVTWNAGLKRYLWCQTVPGGDTRFKGGFGIYEAPEPWGPWRTVAFTEEWDVGPGETQHLPSKWMSEDGTVVHLVFSGNDAFSVRRAELIRRRE